MNIFFKTSTCVAACLILSSCGTLTGIPGHGGGKRFVEEQRLVSASIRGSLEAINISPLRGKRVAIIFSLISDEGSGNIAGGRASLSAVLTGGTLISPVTTRQNALEVYTLANTRATASTTSGTGASTSAGTVIVAGTNTSTSNGTATSTGTSTGTTNTNSTDTGTATSTGASTGTTNTTTSDTGSVTSNGTNSGSSSTTTTTGGTTTTQTGTSNGTSSDTTNTTSTGTTTSTSSGSTSDTTNTTNTGTSTSTSSGTNTNTTNSTNTGSGTNNSTETSTGSGTQTSNTNGTENTNGTTQQVVSAGSTEQSRGHHESANATLNYKGLGDYQVLSVPKSDASLLMSMTRNYMILNGIEVTTPQDPTAEAIVYVTVDIFGTDRKRTDLIIYNNERLSAETAIQMFAADRSGKIIMRPTVGNVRTDYREDYIVWAGPFQTKRKVEEGLGLMNDFSDQGN